MLIKKQNDILSSEITSESVYLNRRRFIGVTGSLIAGSMVAACADAGLDDELKGESKHTQQTGDGNPLNYDKAVAGPDGFYTDEALTPYNDVTSYNNFYEFGLDKADPKRYAKSMETKPWSVAIEGEADNTGVFNLEDILDKQSLQERIYRLRCVEAWSMVVPWVGFPLADLIKKAAPNSKAKYVAFETLSRPKQMRGQRSRFSTIDWPYVEGLRIDEAMHPLTILAVGLYGKTLPNQNGAPLRLVVPWKYGFKSIKSIVKIRFTEQQPATSWNLTAPSEYGFYSNVNPKVSHPRWSQASERRLPASLFAPNRIDTTMFNGYADQVAGLYTNMDLKRYF